MRRTALIFSLFAVFLFASCSNKVEKLRKNGDVEAQLDYAYELLSKKKYNDAIILFEAVMPVLRGNPRQEDVYYKYAQAHFDEGLYTSAAFYYKQFGTNFPLSAAREEAEYMSAYCFIKQSPVYRLDQTPTKEAIDGLEAFANRYPTSPHVAQINDQIDVLRVKLEQKAFAEGQLYYDLKEFPSAMQSFDNLLKEFPESPRVEEVRFLSAKAAFLYANNSVLAKQKERFESFLERSALYLRKHPKGVNSDEITRLRNLATASLKELNHVRY
jgi:outer membrane protein assembly factor BamD